MTDKLTLRPVSFSVTYGKPEIEDYLEECKEDNETPSQEGFNLYVMRNFEEMLEESPRVSNFERNVQSFGFDIETWDIYLL